MPISRDQLNDLVAANGNVVNTDGQKIGGIGTIYLDDRTGEPEWVTVKTGLFGASQSFVPLRGADVVGNDIEVDYDKDIVKDAPRVDADGDLTPEEEQRLYDHYGLTRASGRARSSGYTAGDVDYDRDRDRDTVGYDTSGPTTDDAMTRSEERLNVGTRSEEAGRARLRKYVVTENVTQTVPVSREERPVVEKEAVPVERVRLGTETVTDQETVSEQVRKEQIDTDIKDGRSNR